MKVYVDIETRSRIDLKKLGVYRYSEDSEFTILMAGWAVEDGPVEVTFGQDTGERFLELQSAGAEFVAHNAGFERVCFSRFLDVVGYLSPERWECSMALAAEYGYPVSLEAAARAVGAAPKDSAGAALVRLFTIPNRAGGWNDYTTHPLDWLDFISYCSQDVATLQDLHQRLGDWPNAMEQRVWCVDQRVNDRGMKVDLAMCAQAAKSAEENRALNALSFSVLTGVANPNSVPQVMRWVKEAGLQLPNLQADTIERALADPELPSQQREALELRQELALAAGGKFGVALETASPDGRLRGGFRFFGAHTGRWAGQRVQPHNLPRATLPSPAHVDAAIMDLELGLGGSPHTLKALVRSMFTGPLTIADFASIEARVIAWMAGEEWALQAFRDGRDIYVETAQRMGGLTRFQGKVAVLALGYNGGVNSLRAMGAEGEDDLLQAMVNTWRRANPRIVKLWAQMQDAVDAGGPVGKHVRVVRRGSKMEMKLPSGRSIWYHGVAWEKYKVTDPATGKTLIKEGWRYNDPKKGGQRIGTYGGRLCENATQAIARDLLAEAMVRLNDAGLKIVLHVHDEIGVEGYHLEDLERIMTEVPRWAKGMPIDASAFTCERYRKG